MIKIQYPKQLRMGHPELITVLISQQCTPLSLSMQIVASSDKSDQLSVE